MTPTAELGLATIAQYHDEPYGLWRQYTFKHRLNQERIAKLLSVIQDWDLFLAFLIVDGCTEGKSREPLHWFFEQIRGKVESRFTEEDILE